MNACPTPRNFFLALIVTTLLNAILLFYFHDKYWLALDDGPIAHFAERLAGGEVLNRDLDDLHSGYRTFVNAWALQIWGKNFVSLRYPMILFGLLQSCLVFLIFARLRLSTAVILSFVPNVLGLFQFLNPNHSWYAVFFIYVLFYLWVRIPRDQAAFYLLSGFIIMTIYLFRQLTGVFIALGVVSYLLLPTENSIKSKNPWAAKALSFIMLLGLLAYLDKAAQLSDRLGLFLFGIWPAGLLFYVFIRTQMNNREVMRMAGLLAAGAGFAFLPLLVYLLQYGTLFLWIDDTIVRSQMYMNAVYPFNLLTLKTYIQGSWENIVSGKGFAPLVNGWYWLSLIFLAPLHGLLLWFHFVSNRKLSVSSLGIPFLAIFSAVLSLIKLTPIYLYFSVGISLTGLAWLLYTLHPRWLTLFNIWTVFLCLVGLYFQAAQPIQRTTEQDLSGERLPLVWAGDTFKRMNLWISQPDFAVYSALVRTIESRTQPNDPIFTVPNSCELYFLTGRRNPFAFYGTDVGITNDTEFAAVMSELEHRPPRLIIYVPQHKCNTAYSQKIMQYVKSHYSFIEQIGGFEIYQRSGENQI